MTHTPEQLIKLAREYYGEEVRDNSKEELEAIGRRLEKDGYELADFAGDDSGLTLFKTRGES